MKKTSLFVAIILLALATGFSQKISKPRPGAPGSWKLIGTTQADFKADHDAIMVQGPFDDFRKVKFAVTNAPLNLMRMVVTYDNGMPDKIDVRQNIPQGGESRVIDLKGAGKRSIRKIEYWYDTKGILKGKATITIFGMK
jgi:hypothetical protein